MANLLRVLSILSDHGEIRGKVVTGERGGFMARWVNFPREVRGEKGPLYRSLNLVVETLKA